MIKIEENKLVFKYDAEKLWIEPWGDNSLRIRATKMCDMPKNDWALTEECNHNSVINIVENGAEIINGKIKAFISNAGKISIYNDKNELILREYTRNRRDLLDEKCSALEIEGREFKPNVGGDYHLRLRLESISKSEKLFGMGQYQQPFLNLKGMDFELAHRNSQVSIPFMLSSLGYGFFWNNPAVGRAVLGRNEMSFEAYSTKKLDYWITVGDTPNDIEKSYASVTGKVPMMPEYGLGFWQCKLRYETQDELLEVAREYKKRNIPIDVIVIDFFHWKKQGEWSFDPQFWPDPDSMVKELKEMGIELMVSIWPTVDYKSENYAEMLEKGYLIRTERGIRICMDFEGNTIHYDATNPEAQDYVWQKAKKNYYDKGIKIFWLDEAEPEYSVYNFDNYRYHLGTDLEIGNIYPLKYAETFYNGMKNEGQENIVNLLRCAWAGSQKYGALVWSGDIASSFESMRNQLSAGLNMGIAGIPWWTTDIGGFHGGDPNNDDFRELFVRWFQFGTFCPVMRLHGDREPKRSGNGENGCTTSASGADNEVWSYGDKVYEICKKYINLRETMREYTRELMKIAHEEGTPIIRPMFYEFPEDEKCLEISESYMYGYKYLVAPVLYEKQENVDVYLPKGYKWQEMETGTIYDGGQKIIVPTKIDSMPVFIRL